MGVAFEKYEGLGNDFVVIEAGALEAASIALTPAWVAAVCDRHRGVGADGVLVVGEDAAGRPSMKVHNADGSVPEMCGNGVRCVGLYLRAAGRVSDAPFELATDAGPHRVHAQGAEVEVWMRPASLAPSEVPILSDRPWVDEPLEVDGRVVRVTAVSMGNPHAVTFDDLGDARAALGPRLERDPRFPARVNVGFASRTDAGLELAVWERGVGWTQACGTGACAAAYAAVQTGRASRGEDLEVHLPGGRLVIRVDGDAEPIRMRGPARHVFRGTL